MYIYTCWYISFWIDLAITICPSVCWDRTELAQKERIFFSEICFKHKPFSFQNSPIGSPVFQVKANDPDDPKTPSGTLIYRILDDTADAEAFEIDENTGLITTAQVLDREAKDMYNIILEVSDNGQPKQSVTRILQIKVLDVDDHKPRFGREVVSFFIF